MGELQKGSSQCLVFFNFKIPISIVVADVQREKLQQHDMMTSNISQLAKKCKADSVVR